MTWMTSGDRCDPSPWAVEMSGGLDGFWAVVPAGGAGTRLWPLSRAGRPKFLLDLTGSGRSLIQATVDRVRSLADERVLVVTGAAHEEAVRAQLPTLGAGDVLAEPSPRDSMAAIAWAAAVIETRDAEAAGEVDKGGLREGDDEIHRTTGPVIAAGRSGHGAAGASVCREARSLAGGGIPSHWRVPLECRDVRGPSQCPLGSARTLASGPGQRRS